MGSSGTNALNHDPTLLRSFLITRLAVPRSLLCSIVDAVLSKNVEAGIADQLSQILRMVLDPDSMLAADKEQFLDHFYATHVQKLVTALSQPLSPSKPHQVSQYQACELLSFCVHQHGYRIKQHILNHDVCNKVANLIRVKGRPSVVCSAVRFLRITISLKDDMIARQIVTRKVLDSMLEVFAQNGSRYNLLNSAVIEVVHFIRIENIKILVDYLVRNHEAKFTGIEYVQTFQELKLRWEQNEEYVQQGGGGGSDNNGVVTDDQNEYSYFEKDSDEENEPVSQEGNEANGGDEDEKQRDFITQTDLMLPKRAREDDEVDLVRAKKRMPSKTRTNGGITMSFKAR